jgi:hypothetical protein
MAVMNEVEVKLIPVKATRRRMVLGELQPPEEKTLTFGEKVDQYIQVFGSLPLSVRNGLQILLTHGKVRVDFDDGSNERVEMLDLSKLMTRNEAVSAMEIYSSVSTRKTIVGKDITERITVQSLTSAAKSRAK